MRLFKKGICAFALILSFAAGTGAQEASPLDVQTLNQRLFPGINLGNVLEANPPESWGGKVDPADFKAMAQAGFKSVRIPVRWSVMAAEKKPFTIQTEFFTKVDLAVKSALDAGLLVVLNIHHYEEIFTDPDGHWGRFMALWEQIAAHYASQPRELLFEILNEPHGKLTVDVWNMLYPEALQVIRKTNPTRAVVVDAADWGGAGGFARLRAQKGDNNLIFSFHHYQPFEFTHQGAEWVGAQSKAWLGREWKGTESEVGELRAEFEKAVTFARRNKVPIYLGEFGAYNKADLASRVRWTRAITQLAKEYSFGTAYWEFKSGFGIYDASTGKWNEELKAALLP